MSRVLSGSTLSGRYVLAELIASGGMGDVWRATDQRLRREVAVKILRSEFARDEATRHRFRVEAQAAAGLTSSGIATVYDYGEDAGTDEDQRAYIVMELVHGESLEERVQRVGRLGAFETLDIVAQAAVALQVAHDRDLVHRDIKPANLLLRTDGILKLTDFGIVRVLDTTSLTQTGIMVGTVRYMSPEQLSGQAATPASDIYSLGIVAYFCVAGHTPYDYVESMAVAMAHVNDPLPPTPTDVPAGVRQLISQMLDKDPARRPPTATNVAQRAVGLQDSLLVPASGTPPMAVPTQMSTRAGGATRPLSHGQSEVTGTYPPTLNDRLQTAIMPTPVVNGGSRKNRSRRRRWVLIATVLVVATTTAISLALLAARPTLVSVPRLRGLSTNEARASVDRLGLRTDQHFVDVNQKAGRVVAQVPRQGSSVPSGSRVVLDVASGYVTVEAVALQGKPAAQAMTALSSLGLKVVQTTAISANTPGSVVAISPAGRVRLGAPVVVTVAVAPPPPTTTTTTVAAQDGGAPSHGKHGKGNDH